MVDFAKKLKEQREKEALANQLDKLKKKSAPNMNPWHGQEPKKEPPPPSIKDLGIKLGDRLRISKLVNQHAQITQAEAEISAQKKEITQQLKELCKVYGLSKFMVDDIRSNYYPITRSRIIKEKLLDAGVSVQTLTACTEVSVTEAFKTYRNGNQEEDSSD